MPYDPYQLPNVPERDPYVNKRFFKPNAQGVRPSLTFGQGVTQGTGMSSSGLPDLIDRQISETERAAQATRAARQGAIDSLQAGGREFDARTKGIRDEINNQIAGYQSGQLDDPFRKSLKTNIQSILTNPNPYSATERSNMESNINDRVNQKLHAALMANGAAATGRGVSRSGINVNATNDLYSKAAADTTGQLLDFNDRVKQLAAQREAAALGGGVSLSNEDKQLIEQLYREGGNIDTLGLQGLSDRNSAIAAILGGTEYAAPDYSGLFNTLAGSRTAMKQDKKGTTNGILGALGGIGGGLVSGLIPQLFPTGNLNRNRISTYKYNPNEMGDF